MRAIVVAGPGVVPDGVDDIRRFARATGVGVLNTFGVKGLFRWDDPAHLGTIGLQARDVELAGLLDADVDAVIAVGLDEQELGLADLGPRAEVVTPAELASWEGRVEPAPRGRLYDELRAALLPLYDSEDVPLTPAAAVADLAAVLPAGGLVCADPGPVGLWVARALPTLELGSVYVPAVDSPDLALRRARAAAAQGHAAMLVTDRDVAAEPGVVVERWMDEQCIAPASSAPSNRADRRWRLEANLAAGGGLLETPVELALTDVLVKVAGPVTAWTRPSQPSVATEIGMDPIR
ncbi:MAG TPA: hypothetical protein VGJ03_01255 [Acidimicrobiales bacterium]